MLPRSWLRLADWKSNSSTRFPRTTTTRVSSGWVASMSILLAIDLTLGGAKRARSPPRRRAEDARRTELWVETNGRQRAMRRTRMRSPAAAHSGLVGHPRHDPALDGATLVQRLGLGRDADRRGPQLVALAKSLRARPSRPQAHSGHPWKRHRLQPTIRDPPSPAAAPLRGHGSSLPDARTRQN